MLRFGQVLFSAEERSDEYTCLSAARGRIAAGTSLGAVHIYAVAVSDHTPRLELIARSEASVTDSFLRTRLTCVKLSPCATYLAVGTKNGTVTVYSIKCDRGVIVLSVELQHNEHRGRSITAFAWSSQSDRLYSGCEGGRLFEAVVASKAKGRLIDSFRLAGSFFGISNVTEIPDKTSRGVICKLEYANVQAGVKAVDCATEVLVVAGANYVTLYGFTGDNEMRPMQKVQASDSKIDSVALHQVADEANGIYCKGLYISQPGGVLCYFSLDATTLSSMQLRATPQLRMHERDLWFVDVMCFPDMDGGNGGLLARTATGKVVVIDTANSLLEIPADFEHTEGLAETAGYVFVLHAGTHGQQISALQLIIPSAVTREPNSVSGAQVIHAIIQLQRLFRGKQLRKRLLAEIRKKESALSPQQVLLSKLSKLDEELGNALVAREAQLEEIIFDQASQGFGLPQRANGLSRFTSMDTDAEEELLPEVDKCVSATNRFLRSCDREQRPNCTSDEILQSCDDLLAASRHLLHIVDAEVSEAEDETTSSNTDDEGPAAGHRGRYSEGAAEMDFPMNGYASFAEAAEAMVAITQLVLASSYQTVVMNDSRAAHLLGEDDELLHRHDRGGHTPTKQSSGSVRAMLDGVTNVLTHSKKITQTVNKKMFELIEGVKEGIHAAHSRSSDNLQALLNGNDLVDQDTAQAPPPESGDAFVRYEPMPQPDDEMLANIRARRHRTHASRSVEVADIGDIADDGVSHLPPNQYEVVLLAPRGIGLNLAILGRDLVVRDFNTLDNGETAPAEQSGVIEIGDILVGVNGLDLRQLPLDDTVDLLQRMNEIATEPITLRFMYADAVRTDEGEEDFLLGMFEAMTAPTELRAMQYLHNGARSALLDTVDEAELELRRRRHAARSVDHAAASPKDVTQESSYRPTRASMIECIEDMKAQVRELKRAEVSGWFDNEQFSRLLRDQETRASELREADTDGVVDTRVYIPPLSPTQAAAMRAALYSRTSSTELAVATPRRTPLDRPHDEKDSGYDSQGYLIWFDQAAPQDRVPEDVVVDVTGAAPSQRVSWDGLDPILEEEGEVEEKEADALDADTLVSQLSNDLVDQLGAVMAGESGAGLASTVLPPIPLTCQLTELLAVQSSLTNAATEIDQLLQMWLRCFTPLPYAKRNSLLDEVQAACSLSVFDAQQHTEMARDLVTIYFCLHTAWRWLDAGNKGKSERGANGGADITARVQRVCRLALIDLQILWEPCSDSGKLPAPVQWSQAEASRFIAQYGAYLHLDPVCIACNTRRFSDSLEVAMQVAACDATWQAASTKLGQLAKDGAAVVGARALLTALAEPNKYAFNLYVSSLLLHLGTLYRKDDQLATEVCVLLFPAIRPWNVKWALVGNLAQRLLSPPTASAEDGLDDTMREWLWVARRKYHQYLNVLMRSRTDTIGLSWEIVHQWLEVSLILATAELSAAETPSAAQRARKFIVSSRHILKHQLQYKYRARDAIECCRRYRFAEGILEACKQSLTYQSEQSNSAMCALPADRLLPVEEMSGVVTDTIDKLLRHEYPQDGRLWTGVSTGLRLLWAVALHLTATEADAMSWLVEQLAALTSDHAQRAAQHDESAKRICNNFAQTLAQALGPSRAIACVGRLPRLLAVLERSFFASCCDLSVV